MVRELRLIAPFPWRIHHPWMYRFQASIDTKGFLFMPLLFAVWMNWPRFGLSFWPMFKGEGTPKFKYNLNVGGGSLGLVIWSKY